MNVRQVQPWNGAFLDSNAVTGLANNSRGSGVPGRYLFAIRNGGASSGGSIGGNVTDTATPPHPVDAAPVQVCLTDDSLCVLTHSVAGVYSASGLPAGTYKAKAFAPAGSSFIPTEIVGLTLAAGGVITDANIHMPEPTPPPAGTSLLPNNGNVGGVPVVYRDNALTLTTTGCTGATSATWHVDGSGFHLTGPMTEGPDGTYVGTIPPFSPNYGAAIVSMHLAGCPDPDASFDIYIDPSGLVRRTTGGPIAGATVTLYRSEAAGGPFLAVPAGSDAMSPSNRANPDTTDAAGHFGWDVTAGFYKVRAQATGCHAPGNRSQAFVETGVLTIPPAVTSLELILECVAPDTITPVLQRLIDAVNLLNRKLEKKLFR